MRKPPIRRVDIRAILRDPAKRRRLIRGVVEFVCAMEGHEHPAGYKHPPYEEDAERNPK